jgi:pimeloyl-ACP methyl ester carboxylesterase
VRPDRPQRPAPTIIGGRHLQIFAVGLTGNEPDREGPPLDPVVASGISSNTTTQGENDEHVRIDSWFVARSVVLVQNQRASRAADPRFARPRPRLNAAGARDDADYVNTITQILDAAVDPVVLVVHSRNGIVATQATEERPEKIRTLVCLATIFALRRELADAFPHAPLSLQEARLEEMVAQVVTFLDAPHQGLDLPLDIRGSALEQTVWQALRDDPVGEDRHLWPDSQNTAVARHCTRCRCGLRRQCARSRDPLPPGQGRWFNLGLSLGREAQEGADQPGGRGMR